MEIVGVVRAPTQPFESVQSKDGGSDGVRVGVSEKGEAEEVPRQGAACSSVSGFSLGGEGGGEGEGVACSIGVVVDTQAGDRKSVV